MECLIIQTIAVNPFNIRQPSEFLAQWQRIVAQRHKIVHENVESWYF
jgi:hypothetical protein